jgi:putative Mn2+ efflux pump MntP
MDLPTILVIAVGLSMDAFAVSVASGSVYKKLEIRHALLMALSFGAFQAIMPIAGWLGGLGFRRFIQDFDHWVAFALLAIIGLKMIYEAFAIKKVDKKLQSMNFLVLLTLSVATSIDALAVGITLSLLNGAIVTAVIIIGLVTFCFSYAGVQIGKNFGHFLESKIEIIGGLVLIGIGVKILIEHLISS